MPPEVRNMSTLPKTPKLSLSDALLRFHPLVFFASYILFSLQRRSWTTRAV
jgi:hypothetical protein